MTSASLLGCNAPECVSGEKRNTEGVSMGKPERRLPLGRPGRRCEYNIKMAVKEI